VSSQIITIDLPLGLNLHLPNVGFTPALQQSPGLLPRPKEFFHYAQNLKKNS